jgi:hypothetical protein
MGTEGFYTMKSGRADDRETVCTTVLPSLPEKGMGVVDVTIPGVEWCTGDVLSVETQLSCVVGPGCGEGATVFLKKYVLALEVAKFPADRIPRGIVESFTEVFGESDSVNYAHARPLVGVEGIVVLDVELLAAERGSALRSLSTVRVKDGATEFVDGEWTLPLGWYHVVACIVFTRVHCLGASMWLDADCSGFRGAAVG